LRKSPTAYSCVARNEAVRESLEDRDENNRTRCYGRCACTRVDTGQRGF
jgi:hypothetical protein